MPFPTVFANLPGGNQQLSLFDAMFNFIAALLAIPCIASGVNSITLTSATVSPVLTAYTAGGGFRFLGSATSTGAISAQYQTLANLPVYLADGVTQAGAGNIVLNEMYVLIYSPQLNNFLGGFYLEQASIPATTGVGGSAFSNFQAANGGSGTLIVMTYDELVMNNPAGFPIRATSQSFVVNAGTVGPNGLDTGALANNSVYALWGISTGATAAGLLSLSFSNPTMPGGYTYKKRVGAFITNGSAQLFGLQLRGNRAQFTVQAANPSSTIVDGFGVVGTFSTTTPTLVSQGVFVPPSAKAVIVQASGTYKGGATASVLVAPNGFYSGSNNGPAGSNGMIFPIYISGADNRIATIILEAAQTVQWCSSAAGGALGTLGWEDNLV